MKKKKLKLSLNKMTVARIITDSNSIKGGNIPLTAPSVQYCPTQEECLSPNPCNATLDCSRVNVDTICLPNN